MPRKDSTLKLKDGRSLGYSTVGDPNGRAVLYFHGGLSSRLDIDFADKQLADMNIKLFAPDRPGIGLSDRRRGRTLSDWASDTKEFITALELKQPPLLGWSLGGPYALACAALISNMLGKIGTVGGVGPLDYKGAIESLGMLEDRILMSWPEPLLHALSPAGSMLKYLPPKMIKDTLLRTVKAGPDYEICEAMSLEEATAWGLEAVRQGFEGSLDDYLALRKPWGFAVENLESEILMWQGTDDHLCPQSLAHVLVSRLPKGKLMLVENSGHFLLHKHLVDIMSTLLN